jgi:hypothetical protein
MYANVRSRVFLKFDPREGDSCGNLSNGLVFPTIEHRMNIKQFTSEFELARPQLKSYILRITASIEDTEDIVQDTFIRASSKLDTFRGQSSLKTWIFKPTILVFRNFIISVCSI